MNIIWSKAIIIDKISIEYKALMKAIKEAFCVRKIKKMVEFK